jgi:hypothetical protein
MTDITRSHLPFMNYLERDFLKQSCLANLGYHPVPPHSILYTENSKGGSITVLLTSCLTGLESAVRQLMIFVFIYKTD